MKKIVVLYSGGLDSRILYLYALKRELDAEVKCIYYKHGAESEKAEIAALPNWVEVRKVDWLNDSIRPQSKKSDPFAGEIYIPGRNLVFATLAASQELPDEIWMGTMADEDNQQATDKNSKFRMETSKLLSYVLSPFKDNIDVRFPYVEEGWSKIEMVKWALDNGMTDADLKQTVSCWHYEDGLPCGVCKQCLKRFLVFQSFGIEENFRVNPPTSDDQNQRMRGYLDVYSSGIANADEKAVAEMIISGIGKFGLHI